MSRLAQIAYRQYVRNNGYPKDGDTISLGLSPSVYKEVNSSGKDNIGNTQSFIFEIPSDTISGDYKGRLRDIKPGKYKQ